MITAPEIRERDPLTTITGKYLSITSYRRDGTGVATPVWFVIDGPKLLVQTDAGSFKVRRIRRDPHVSIATCSARGKILGETVEAHAEVLPWDAERVEPLLQDKYRVGLVFIRPLRAIQKALHLGRTEDRPVLLEITPSERG